MTGRVVFLSNHVFESRRKAGFHSLADAFVEAGWHVSFVTTGISRLSFARGDRRLQSLSRANVNRTVITAHGVDSHVYMPLVHPVRVPGPLGVPARLAFASYGRRLGRAFSAILASADLVIFESNASVFLFDAVKRIAPRAKTVYRVSDDVRTLAMSPLIREKEDAVLARFDLISVPSRLMMAGRFGAHPNCRFHPHGIADGIANGSFEDPFSDHVRPKAVSVGSTLFDHDFIRISAAVRGDIDFHIVGDFQGAARVEAPNVIYHGELPFLQAAAFSAHADIALAPYRLKPGAEYLAETSNKIIQYGFFGKKIIAPRVLIDIIDQPNLIPYDFADERSIAQAYEAALALDLSHASLRQPPRWGEVKDMILAGL